MPVSTIGYGTQEGVVVSDGVTYQVPVDLAALRQVAGATGGTAYEAATADQLREVYDDIGSALVAETAREDVSDLLAGAGLLLLVGTAVPSLSWSFRLVRAPPTPRRSVVPAPARPCPAPRPVPSSRPP